MSNTSHTLWALALVLGLGLPVQAQAARNTADKPVKLVQKKRKVVKVAPAVERTASGETVTDRERRLRRECKGRANAGACLGFTN